MSATTTTPAPIADDPPAKTPPKVTAAVISAAVAALPKPTAPKAIPSPLAKIAPVFVKPTRTLMGIKKCRIDHNPFLVIHGEGGVGKSVLASLAPNPIMVDVDGGSKNISIARVPKSKDPVTGAERYTWEDIFEAPLTLLREDTGFETFVLDSLDQAERVCWEHLVAKNPQWKGSIEGAGFGKGYIAALEQWQIFVNNVIRLVDEKNMTVIMIAHTEKGSETNDGGDQFSTLRIQMHKKSAGLIKQRADAVLFYRKEVLTTEKNGKFVAVQTNRRIMHTDGSGVYDAKNRYALPPTLIIPPPPHSWQALADAIAANKPSELKKKIDGLLAQLTERTDIDGNLTSVEKVKGHLATANDEPSMLLAIIEAIEGKLGHVADETPATPAEEGAST